MFGRSGFALKKNIEAARRIQDGRRPVRFRPFFSHGVTISLVPTARCCLVSFTDSENIRHAVEVSATTLYEAAVLAMAEFRRCGFTANAPGPATRLTVTVKTPGTTHEVQWGKIEAWLQNVGKPNEQAMKSRLRELSRAPAT
jgi:hypothetical protein